MKSATIGKKLRRARLDRKLRLPELQEETKIQPDYLKRMESGDFGFFPKPIMVGFIKSYAQALGIDHEPLIKLFEEAARKSGVQRQVRDKAPLPMRSSKPESILDAKPKSEVSPFASAGKENPKPASSQSEIKSEKPLAGSVKTMRSTSDQPGWFEKNRGEVMLGSLVLLIVTAIIIVYFRYSGDTVAEQPDPVEKISVFDARQQNLDEAESEEPEIEPIRIPETVKLRVVAAETTWVQLIRDEADTNEYIFEPGNDRSFEADSTFELRLGRADGLIFWVNSDSVGRMGSAAEIVSKLVITPRGITEKRVRPPLSLAQ